MKVMRFKNEHAKAMIEREITIMQKISHENIIEMIAFKKEANKFQVAMNLCTGSVKLMLKRGISFGDDEFVQLVKNMTSAMEYLYHHRIAHRDIKPDNIGQQRFVLGDFGLATEYDHYDRKFHGFCGTVDYCHPNMLESVVNGNLAPYSIECDIYSLGVTFFECITLQKPFQSKFRDSKLRAQQILIKIKSKFSGAIYWSDEDGCYYRHLKQHGLKNEFTKKMTELLLMKMLETNQQMKHHEFFAEAKKIFD